MICVNNLCPRKQKEDDLIVVSAKNAVIGEIFKFTQVDIHDADWTYRLCLYVRNLCVLFLCINRNDLQSLLQ